MHAGWQTSRGALVRLRRIVGMVTIVPDSKDWTWVLERRCPECGFDSGARPREAVAGRTRAAAAAFQEILGGPSDAVRTRPSPERWSPLEYACHVRDVFRIFDERLRLMLTVD